MSRSEPTAPDERGFTLVEMVVTLLVMSIITAAFLTVFNRAVKDTGTVQSRRDYLNEMRFAMETMTKQIRQATVVDPQLPDHLGMDTLINGNEHHIRYQVQGSELKRQTDGGNWVTVVSDLTSSAVFSYGTVDGTIQQIRVSLTVDTGTTTVDLISEVEMRNL